MNQINRLNSGSSKLQNFIADIFILLKYENELERVTSDISFNSVSPLINLNLYSNSLVGNYYQFISIWSYTKMQIMPTSAVLKKN